MQIYYEVDLNHLTEDPQVRRVTSWVLTASSLTALSPPFRVFFLLV